MRIFPLIIVVSIISIIVASVILKPHIIKKSSSNSELRMVGADSELSSDSASLIVAEQPSPTVEALLTPTLDIPTITLTITSEPLDTITPTPTPVVVLTIEPSVTIQSTPTPSPTPSIEPTPTTIQQVVSTPTVISTLSPSPSPVPKDMGCDPVKPTDLRLDMSKKLLSWVGRGGCSGGTVTYAVRIDSRSASDYDYSYRMNGGCTDFNNQAWNSSAKSSWDVCYTQVGAEEISKYDFNPSEGYDIWINATCAISPPLGCKKYSESINVKFDPN